MGGCLCKRTGERSTAARRFDGLYRKIVFNCDKQWTSYSEKRKKSKKKNTKHNKSNRQKPIISEPFPADLDLLHGDKWQYVILTRLDTEPPPKRPPRSKQCCQQETVTSGVNGIVRWGSERRRSFGSRWQPKTPQSKDELTEPVTCGGGKTGERTVVAEKKASSAFDVQAVQKSSLWVSLWSCAIVSGRMYAVQPNGLLKSVTQVRAMANDLLS